MVNVGHLICFLQSLEINPPGVSADFNFPQPDLSFNTKIWWYSTFLAQRFYIKVVFLGVKMSDTNVIIFLCMSLYSYKQHYFSEKLHHFTHKKYWTDVYASIYHQKWAFKQDILLRLWEMANSEKQPWLRGVVACWPAPYWKKVYVFYFVHVFWNELFIFMLATKKNI